MSRAIKELTSLLTDMEEAQPELFESAATIIKALGVVADDEDDDKPKRGRGRGKASKDDDFDDEFGDDDDDDGDDDGDDDDFGDGDDDDFGDEDDEDEAPKRGRGKTAAKKPAGRGRGRR